MFRISIASTNLVIGASSDLKEEVFISNFIGTVFRNFRLLKNLEEFVTQPPNIRTVSKKNGLILN